MPDRTTLIVLAARTGDPVTARDIVLPEVERVIAADSGLHLANRLGLAVDVLIGDLDSVQESQLRAARGLQVEIDLHPRDKDHTDLALALARARQDGARAVLIIGGAGGRLDHGLANLLALADPSLADVHVTAQLGGATITVVRDQQRTITGVAGSLVSLVAIGASATVTTDGLRWDLHGDLLPPTSTRGVSNELLGTDARITADAGVVLAIQPAIEESLEL